MTNSNNNNNPNLKASVRATGKRKLAQSSPGSTPGPPEDSTYVAQAPVLVPSPLPGFFSTRNHPMNKSAFRYVACGPSPLSTERFPLYRVIQSQPANTVAFSWEDRSSYVYISPDASSVSTEKGFRSARANVPLREGQWYFEVSIEKGAGDPTSANKAEGTGPHVRLGLGRREAQLNAPVGFDGYSYGIRDKTGDKVHLSQPRQYGQSFGTGDVVGVYVNLAKRPSPPILPDDPNYREDPRNPARIVRKRVAIRYKGQLYFESMEYAASKEMEDLAFKTKDPVGYQRAITEAAAKKAAPPPGKRKAPPPPPAPPARPLPTIPGSKVAFFKNGECQGIAFEDLLDWLPLRQHRKVSDGPTPRVSQATAILLARENHHDDGHLGYYPFISVFGGAVAKINPGPHFKYPPPDDIEGLFGGGTQGVDDKNGGGRAWRPLSERHAEYYDELRTYDEIEERQAIENYANSIVERSSMYIPPSLSHLNPSSPAPGNGGAGGGRSSGSSSKPAKKRTALSKEISRETTPGPPVKLEVEERKAETPELEIEVSEGISELIRKAEEDRRRTEELRGPAGDRVEEIVKKEVDA